MKIKKPIEKKSDYLHRDGNNESIWQLETNAYPTTTQTAVIHTNFDCVIIGGGITGITAAYLLQKAGKQCIVIEAHQIGFGTTGGTSAHINTFADTTYREAEEGFGEAGAKLFAEAINEGFDIIRTNIKNHNISCDFEEKLGFLYAENEKQVDQLRDIFEGCLKVGIDAVYTDNVPKPMIYCKALVFKNQAQFHPMAYLSALQQAYLKAGGIIVEGQQATYVDSPNKVHHIQVADKVLKASHLIYATHIPPGINLFSLRCAPYRSYVLGVTLVDNNYPDALIYDLQDPYHYFRTHEIDGKKYLIAGGNDHKTGQEDPDEAFSSLEKYVRKLFAVAEVKYKWSSQYYIPVDGLPYIGCMPGAENVYCATGYNGNGMMLGSIAAKIISDLIINNKSKYEDLFNPSRLKPLTGIKEFISENADVAYQFIASRFRSHQVDFLKRVKKDSGQVVEFEGEKIAVYRSANDQIYALSPVCTHAYCIVNWNSQEKSWDCPCHGARYDINGIVLNGPAEKNLEKIDIT